MPLRLLLIVALSVACCFAQDTRPRDPMDGLPVTRIEIPFLKRLTADAVRARMGLKVGKPFTRDLFTKDLKSLVDAKIFFNISKATAEPDGAGVVVTIVGEENVRVLEVAFFGLVEADREELAPLVKTVAGGLVDSFTLDVDRQAILRWYRAKGFHFAEVAVLQTSIDGGDGVVVVFQITEGPEVKIDEVLFEGNATFSKRDLLKAMPKTAEPGFLSSTEFVLEEVQRDVVLLNRWYQGRGFLDARCTLLGFDPTPDFSKVRIRIAVDEGRRYVVRSVAIEGMTLFDPKEVLDGLKTKAGEPYEPGVGLARDLRTIVDRYQERAYIEANVMDASTLDVEGNAVDVIIRIVEGEITYTGEVVIEGNVETRDNVIRREIEVWTGEPLNLKKFEKARKRIFALQYWQPSRDGLQADTTDIPVNAFGTYRDAYVTLRDTKRDNVKDVVFTVKEKDTGSIRFAFGVGSNNGIVGDVTYRKDNFDPYDLPEGFDDLLDAFTGGGDTLILSVAPGTIYSRAQATYQNPRIWDSTLSFREDLYKTFYLREAWLEERTGSRTTIGHRFGEDLTLFGGLRNEVVETREIETTAPQIVYDYEGEQLVASFFLDAKLMRTDDPIDPTDGYIIGASGEMAGLWGDIAYNKFEAEGEMYFRIGEDSMERPHLLSTRAAAGWMKESGDSTDVPVYERFFVGGSGSLRGFEFRGVGPHENGEPVGGKAYWTAAAEYGFPLVGVPSPGEPSLRGVAFVDTGSLASDWSDSGITDVRVSVGAGIRIVIPFLGTRPVAIDFGIPVLKVDGDETRLVSFSFGSNF